MSLIVIIGSVIAIGCLVMAYRLLRRKRLIDDLPTSKALGVFIGLAELKGTAESEAPLTSHLAEKPCVLFSWRVDEHWSRTVQETYRDAQGHTHTRTRTESGWKTVADGKESGPFYLKDDTGAVRIQPEGARLETLEMFDQTLTPGSPLYFGKCPRSEIAHSSHRRRFYETGIPLHTPLYIMGQARERQDAVAAEIGRDDDAPVFIVSIRNEKQVSSGFLWGTVAWAITGLVFALGGVFTVGILTNSNSIGWQPYVIATASFTVAVALGWYWMVYNSLVSLRQRVYQALAQVDVQLKRRNDLIPNLVEVVSAYRTHEQQTQGLVALLRGQKGLPAISTDLRGLSFTIKAVMESYPELKASPLFLKLQRELAETEQRIALARDYHNNIATFYNGRLEIFPDRLAAALTGFKSQPLIYAADIERAPVQVKLVS